MSFSREYELQMPVREWFANMGYRVFVEQFDCDILAIKDGKLAAVELKLGLTQDVIRQCRIRAGWADFVFAAVAHDPRKHLAFARYAGYGVLQVMEDNSVRQRLIARPQPWMFHKRRKYRLTKLADRPEATDQDVAGLPSGKKWLADALAAYELSE